MEQPAHLHAVIDRHDACVVGVEKPKLLGKYRYPYWVFLTLCGGQFAYSLAHAWPWLREKLAVAGLDMFAPLRGHVSIFTAIESGDWHLYALVMAVTLWAIASLQEKAFGIVTWGVGLIGALLINYGLGKWTGEGGPFVLFTAAIAFVAGHAVIIRAVSLFRAFEKGQARKATEWQSEGLELLGPVALILFGLITVPAYWPSCIAGVLIGGLMVIQRPEVDI